MNQDKTDFKHVWKIGFWINTRRRTGARSNIESNPSAPPVVLCQAMCLQISNSNGRKINWTILRGRKLGILGRICLNTWKCSISDYLGLSQTCTQNISDLHSDDIISDALRISQKIISDYLGCALWMKYLGISRNISDYISEYLRNYPRYISEIISFTTFYSVGFKAKCKAVRANLRAWNANPKKLKQYL